jgi:murein DD-endopeptidase MepM/ murein hydrolase activator NlpD
MLRPVLATIAAALALATGAQAQTGLPSHETPNGPGLVVPFSMSTPPARPEGRSYAQLLELWKAAGAAYGIPWEVLGAINKIESNFGRNMGPSSAGALGWMQFMPSTWMRWGTDADRDGVANPWDPEDAIYSAARYLAAAGAQDDLYKGIFAYNHADWYVRDVLELARVFAGGGGFDPTLVGTLGFGAATAPGGAGLVFQLDDLEQSLAEARKAVGREQRDVRRTERRIAELDTEIFVAEQRAGNPELSDEEFQRVEAEVTRLVVEQERAVESLGREREQVAKAEETLEALRQHAEAQRNTVTFSRPLTNGLGDPQFAGQHVFPVGGGPAVATVGATHHDYPAADIAAPEGTPVYALADGMVVDVHRSVSSRCGLGLRLDLPDGRSYTYCHLSYLEDHVQPGAAVTAGTLLGLVGSTGNSTGPHLHLQRNPTDVHPQSEAWFQSFAGIAFSWDGPPPAPAPGVATASSAASAGGDVLTFTRSG